MGWQMSVPLQGGGVAGCPPPAARVSVYSLCGGFCDLMGGRGGGVSEGLLSL
jgi:hypothetical protein